MENTLTYLQRQIDNRLNQLNQPDNIHINKPLSHLLDQLSVPLNAKLACLSIDTSMKHLDWISFYHYERDAILIGDLMSAHYYQLIADLKDVHFQLKMSQAIVKINELKSFIQHQGKALSQKEFLETIITIETLLIKVLIDRFSKETEFNTLRAYLIKHLEIQHLTYLIDFDTTEIEETINQLQNYIKE